MPAVTTTRAHDRIGVAVGGALGAWLRAGLLAVAAALTGHPAGALAAVVVANLAGTYLLGWVSGRAEHDPRWAARTSLLGVGVAGALTTFSGLALQLTLLAQTAGVAWTTLVAVAHVAVGLLVGRAGLRCGRRPAAGAR